MQFQLRQDVLKNWTTCSFGDNIAVDIPREFFLEGLYLQFEITAGGTAPILQTNKEGWATICDEIRLDVPTGSTVRSPIRTTSSGALHLYRNWAGQLDRDTLYACDRSIAPTWVASEVRYMTIPLMACPPNLDDPASSFFLLPLPRYSANPTLRFTVTAGTNIISVPGNASLRYRIVMNRRFVDIPDFPVFEAEQNFIDIPYSSAGDGQYFELPAPGVFTTLMGQCYDVTDFRTPVSVIKTTGYQAASGTGNTGNLAWTTVDKYFELKFTGVSLRRANLFDLRQQQDLSVEKFPSATNPNFGSLDSNTWMWDFLSDKMGSTAQDFGSALDTNPLVAQGARVQFLASPTLPGGSKLRLHYHRVFGDISPLRRSLAAKAKARK